LQDVNHAGTDAGDLADSALAANLRLLPATPPYRSREGHVYVGGIAAPNLVENAFVSGFVSTLVGLADNLALTFPAGGGGDWQLVILDKSLLSPKDVSNVLVVNKPVHLRRRMSPYPL
jgi:hypothetical protein